MKVKIGAFNYDLEELPSVIDGEGHDCFGTHDFGASRIEIQVSLNNIHKLGNYFHEVLEALNRIYGLDLSHPQIVGVSNSLAQVMQENPELTNRLVGLCPKEDKKDE